MMQGSSDPGIKGSSDPGIKGSSDPGTQGYSHPGIQGNRSESFCVWVAPFIFQMKDLENMIGEVLQT